MNSADHNRVWTGPQLAAQLATLNGVAPVPASFVVVRLSRQSAGGETVTYEVSDEAHTLDPRDWPRWLARRELLGPAQLRVALLVLHETLDGDGRLAECTLERRLGAMDGPFCGDPARVDFIGPARLVRVYRSLRPGQLTQVALSPQILPPAQRGPEPFTGEVRALERRFGPALQVIDAREPTLFEDAVGLASILHVRLPDGTERACGIGWHGTTPFVLLAEFPRFDMPLALPPPEEEAVQEALRRLDLVRHETRLDERGLAVLARRRGGQELFLLRAVGGRASAEPYQPGADHLGSPDQLGWLRYVEVHENLRPLDLHADGASTDLIVLTGDPGGHVWRHLVDADGVETWRRPADDAAVAVLHREQLAPGSLARLEGEPSNGGYEPLEASKVEPDPESLLARLRACQAATAALRAARDAALDSTEAQQSCSAVSEHLRGLPQLLGSLSAAQTASLAELLLTELQAGISSERLVRELVRLEARFQDELGQIRVMPLPLGPWRRPSDAPPFGAEVDLHFPGCAYDVEEAANCLAFRRPTAAVFHCMKVVERGLTALGRRMELPGFPGKLRGWSAILGAVRPGCPEELLPVLNELLRVRQRWHAVGLDPAEKYTEAEAEVVFQSVGTFMRALAARCDEAGDAADRPGMRLNNGH